MTNFQGAQFVAHHEIRIVGLSICFELCISAVFATLAVSPAGSFHMRSCEPKSIADFYPGLRLPDRPCGSVDCAAEVVYPLSTWMMLLLLFGIACLFGVRLPVVRRWCPELGTASIRSSLYIIPMYAAFYTVRHSSRTAVALYVSVCVGAICCVVCEERVWCVLCCGSFNGRWSDMCLTERCVAVDEWVVVLRLPVRAAAGRWWDSDCDAVTRC